MKAGVLFNERDIRYADFEDPKCGDDEVIIKVKACGVCGSDSHRILGQWKYELPAILGHEFSGVIVEKGKNVKKHNINDRVIAVPFIPCYECEYCKTGKFSLCENHGMIGAKSYGAFAELVKVPAANVLNIGDIDFEVAAMIEPLAVALHGVIGISPKVGDTVALLGAGTIGQLVLQWLKIVGVKQVIAVDISELKLNEAKELGADYCINAKDVNPVEEILRITGGRGVDIAIECAGSKITQEQCLLVTRKAGKIGYLGIGRSDILIKEDAFESIFRRELTLQGFWNSYSAPFPGEEWFKSIEYVSNGKIELKSLISHRYKLSEIKELFEMIGERKEEYNKIMVIPD